MNIKTAVLLGTLALVSPALAQDTTNTTATDTATPSTTTTTNDTTNDNGFNWGWLGLLGLAGLAGLRRQPERERIVTSTTAPR